MRGLLRRCAAGALLIGSSLALADDSPLSLVQTHLDAAIEAGFSGTVLLAIDDQLLLQESHGFADGARAVPLAPATPSWIASISKQFTAAAILKLQEQGRLRVEDPIAQHLPVVPDDKRAITIHQLLTHTAGLAQNYAADGIADRDSALAALLAPPLARAPGADFGYTNDAYNVLAILVEVVAQRGFEEFLSDQLLQPAGLQSTGFWGPTRHPEVAPILDADIGGAVALPNWGFRGATGMYSTAEDLWRWQRALASMQVLSESSVNELMKKHWQRDELGIGYGWFRSRSANGAVRFWTRGYEDFGHGAALSWEPAARRVLIVMTNAGSSGDEGPWSHRLSRELVELLQAD